MSDIFSGCLSSLYPMVMACREPSSEGDSASTYQVYNRFLHYNKVVVEIPSWIRIRIRNVHLDPDPHTECESGSGSRREKIEKSNIL